MTEPTTGRRWADDGPTIISSSAHRWPVVGRLPTVGHRLSAGHAIGGPPSAATGGPPAEPTMGRRWATGSVLSAISAPLWFC